MYALEIFYLNPLQNKPKLHAKEYMYFEKIAGKKKQKMMLTTIFTFLSQLFNPAMTNFIIFATYAVCQLFQPA